MSELIIYLIKANSALVLFYFGYRFGLKNLTFYTLNRYYLLFAFLFSSLYPLISWEKVIPVPAETTTGILSIVPHWHQESVIVDKMNWNQFIEILFWVSIVLFMLRLLVKLSGILRIHLNSVPARWALFSYRRSKEDIEPFSFWRNIYLNPDKYIENELENIIKHEYVHVCQLHSTDILVSEIALSLFWYNPICWLIRRDVRENIEFITDQKVLSLGLDKQSYQYSLLNISTQAKSQYMGNHFNFKNLKKRIIMMNKRKSSNTHLSKYVFILPAVIICCIVFGFNKATEHKTTIPKPAYLNFYHPSDTTKEEKVKQEKVIEGKVKKEVVKSKRKEVVLTKNIEAAVKKEVLRKREVPEVKELKKDIFARQEPYIHGMKGKKPLLIIDGIPNPEKVIGDLDIKTIGSMTILEESIANVMYGGLYGERVKEGVVILGTKDNKTSINTTNARNAAVMKYQQKQADDQKRVLQLLQQKSDLAARQKVSGRARVDENFSERVLSARKNVPNTANIRIRGMQNKKPLLVVNGVPHANKQLEDISLDTIESISVLKESEAVAQYGNIGKGGVLVVVTNERVQQ